MRALEFLQRAWFWLTYAFLNVTWPQRLGILAFGVVAAAVLAILHAVWSWYVGLAFVLWLVANFIQIGNELNEEELLGQED